MRERRRSTGSILSSAPNITKRSGRGCPLLRASNEHILIVRALRARRAPGYSSPSPPSLLIVSQGWRLIDLPLRASNEGWSISSIWFVWFVWLVGPEIHQEEPDRPERPANQTDEHGRIARAQKIIRLHSLLCSASKKDGLVALYPSNLALKPAVFMSISAVIADSPLRQACTPTNRRPGRRARRSVSQHTVSSMLPSLTTPRASRTWRLRDFATNRHEYCGLRQSRNY